MVFFLFSSKSSKRSQSTIFKLNCRERSKRKIFGKFCTPPPPNSSKLRSDYLFSFQKRTNYLFPTFSRSEYLFPKSASPPPPESNGLPLIYTFIFMYSCSYGERGFKNPNQSHSRHFNIIVLGSKSSRCSNPLA